MRVFPVHHYLTVSLQEAVDCRESDIEVERFENLIFLVQYLLLRVCVVSDVHKVLNFWHVDFFIFAGN